MTFTYNQIIMKRLNLPVMRSGNNESGLCGLWVVAVQSQIVHHYTWNS